MPFCWVEKKGIDVDVVTGWQLHLQVPGVAEVTLDVAFCSYLSQTSALCSLEPAVALLACLTFASSSLSCLWMLGTESLGATTLCLSNHRTTF